MRGPTLSPEKAKALAGWTGLACALLSFFVLALFPYDLLQARLLTLAGAFMGTNLRAESWEWAWPVGFRWRNVTIKGSAPLEADTLEIMPSGSALVRGKPGLRVVSSLRTAEQPSAGVVMIEIRLDGWSMQAPAQVTGSVDGLDLSAAGSGLARQGTLRVTFDHRWTAAGDHGRFFQGEGTWNMMLSDLSVDRLALGPLTVAPLELSVLSARLLCKEGSCEVQDFHGESPDGTATGTGRFTPRLPFRESNVNLTVDLIPSLSMVQKAGNPMIRAGVPIRLTVSGKPSGLAVTF